MQAVFRDRNEPTAEASFAAIFERSKLGMAIAAMIKMIATTIKSSIKEKPFCLFRINSPSRFEVRTWIRSIRSEERRVGKECGEECSVSDQYHEINKVTS